MLLEMITTLAAGLFAGAAIYINMVEHPARMECGSDLAVPEFGSSYKRGAAFMGLLLTIGASGSIAAWFWRGGAGWLIGAAFLLALFPYTLILVLPINKKLLDPSLDRDSDLASRLLVRWGRLHAFRSMLGLASFLLFVYLLMRSASR
jgi:anthrone oxygenase-like protein